MCSIPDDTISIQDRSSVHGETRTGSTGDRSFTCHPVFHYPCEGSDWEDQEIPAGECYISVWTGDLDSSKPLPPPNYTFHEEDGPTALALGWAWSREESLDDILINCDRNMTLVYPKTVEAHSQGKVTEDSIMDLARDMATASRIGFGFVAETGGRQDDGQIKSQVTLTANMRSTKTIPEIIWAVKMRMEKYKTEVAAYKRRLKHVTGWLDQLELCDEHYG